MNSLQRHPQALILWAFCASLCRVACMFSSSLTTTRPAACASCSCPSLRPSASHGSMVSGRNASLLILDQCYTFAMWLYFNAQDKLKAGAAVQQLFDTQRKGVQIHSNPLCLPRCRPLLRQHWGHDWQPPRPLLQVLLVVLHPGHVHREYQQTDRATSKAAKQKASRGHAALNRRLSHSLSPVGYLCLLAHQVHPSEVQQWVCVPVVGLRHRLAAGAHFHGLHPTVDGVQDQYHPGDIQRGKSDVMWSLMIPRTPHVLTFIFFHLGLQCCSPEWLFILQKAGR